MKPWMHQTCTAAAGAGAVAAGVGWAHAAHRLHHRTRQLRIAHRDPVTGLLTRSGWEHTAPEALRRSSVCGLLDLDGFKQINDTFGHLTGDHVLRVVARRVRGVLPVESVFARLGGDEFVFLADWDSAEIGVLADELLEAITAPLPLGERAVRVGCSAGLVLLRDLQSQPVLLREAVTAADRAMYEAKLFRCGWRRHDPRLHPEPPTDHCSAPPQRVRDHGPQPHFGRTP
ncbi:GGDEF domain-containing protein [Saccharopolyspora sp. NPDC047091]|uniref:GGDEF domain-containing protein n=1 Tax=Saccharopolyspora sp. NPDC047091 TaxID=3155924 RepID=UPI0033D93577